MKNILFLLTLFISPFALSNTMPSVVAKVTGTGSYGDGSIFVFFDRAISSCSSVGRLDIAKDHAAKDHILSIAMTAFASGKSIKINPGFCSGNEASFNQGKESFFYLTNESPN